MAYKWITKYNSPNYTPKSRVAATWGQPRTIKAIAIHWWGDPKQNPKFENIINYLCRRGGNSSAHIVATGTGRQAACLINLDDASWATNSANPYTISIECDPRCRKEDYDVVAEVIAQLRSIYGDLPLVPHNKFVATACPGNYDLKKLDKLAKTKKVSKKDDWGKVSNKDVVTTKDVTTTSAVAFKKTTKNDATLPKGETKVSVKGVNGVRTVVTTVTYTNGKETSRKVKSDRVTKAAVDEVTLVGTYVKPVEPTPPKDDGFNEQDRGVLNGIKKALDELVQLIKNVFNK